MWTIIKTDKKNIELMKQDFLKKLGPETIFYRPRLIIKKPFNKNKKIFYLLSDYVFCFNKLFCDESVINSLKYSKGLKYFINGFKENQNQIKKFIDNCKNSENNEGSIMPKFFKINTNSKFKFLNGPFKNFIFSIMEIQKNKFKVLIGNFETEVNKDSALFKPV